MTPNRARVGQIRRITVAHLRAWAVPAPLVQDVRLVVSELVSNAVEHGRGTVLLRIQHANGRLRIEVRDENPAPAWLQNADAEDVCGRGLFLVDALASMWGVSDDGRATWAVFALPGGT
ncbi:ATP-binding protein [Streptomyces sp. NPDC093085]|uniref:ATP-binding protein n=1 Tax=Streptomyces sp. NPDC093085 TaxID=3155068 RepID=UPI003442559B